MTDDAAPRIELRRAHRKLLLGGLSVALFFAAWQAVFLFVPFNPLFISKPSLIARGLVDLIASGDLFRDLAVSAVPFVYGFGAAVRRRRPARHRHGLARAAWATRSIR